MLGGVGPAPVPIPAKGTSWGLLTPGVLSVMRNVSVCGPTVVGENSTVIEQLEPELKVAPQVFEVIENCVPAANATDEIATLPELVLEKVMVCAADVEQMG